MSLLLPFIISVIFMVTLFELTFFIQKIKGLLPSILFILVVDIILCLNAFVDAGQYARESKAFLLIVNYIITSLLPSITIVWISWQNKHLKQKEIHSTAIIVAVANTIFLPFIALFTSCYSGLDCI